MVWVSSLAVYSMISWYSGADVNVRVALSPWGFLPSVACGVIASVPAVPTSEIQLMVIESPAGLARYGRTRKPGWAARAAGTVSATAGVNSSLSAAGGCPSGSGGSPWRGGR